MNINKEIDSLYLIELAQIINEKDIYKWNTFAESDDSVLDGASFSIEVYYSDGKELKASGYMKYPQDYKKCHEALVTFFEKLIKVLTGQKVTDPTSGLRVADRKVIEEFAKQYPSDYPEPETIVSLLTSGYSVAEVPVLMNEREHGESSITLSKSVYYMIKVTMAMLLARIGGGYKK